jgi:hypothetical protein
MAPIPIDPSSGPLPARAPPSACRWLGGLGAAHLRYRHGTGQSCLAGRRKENTRASWNLSTRRDSRAAGAARTLKTGPRPAPQPGTL